MIKLPPFPGQFAGEGAINITKHPSPIASPLKPKHPDTLSSSSSSSSFPSPPFPFHTDDRGKFPRFPRSVLAKPGVEAEVEEGADGGGLMGNGI